MVGEADKENLQVVDTVYAKVLAINGKTQELAALIQDERSEIVATEIEPVLVEHSQFDALTTLYQRHGDARKLLGLYSKCVVCIFLMDGD